MMRSSVDRSGWIGLRWGTIGMGGSVFGGDAISVVVRDIWRRWCWGAGDAKARVRLVDW